MNLKDMDDFYRQVMTKFLAEDIKQWRVTEGCSWRMVHVKYQEKYVPEDKWSISEELVKHFGVVPNGNQMDGMSLCQNAMIYLGEVVEDGWN